MKTYHQLYINGQWVNPQNQATFASINPFDESHLADIASASPADAEKAVQAARQAFGSWSGLTGKLKTRRIVLIFMLIWRKNLTMNKKLPLSWGTKPLPVSPEKSPLALPQLLFRGIFRC